MTTGPGEAFPLAAKLEHLARPASYGADTPTVERMETHLSYVFLTGRYVYKFKKPVRDAFRDFSTLEGRRLNCEEEVRLNRRLAPGIYLGVVALAQGSSGLALEGAGEPVEWLVKMRRLPREQMLDAALRAGRVSDHDIARVVAALAAFYRVAQPAPLSAVAYRARFERSIDENRTALVDPRYGLERAGVESVADGLLAFVADQTPLLNARAARLVEGHGDLRPEHVCLDRSPLFIDCLEFDRNLRVVDPADEVAYLATECLYLGAHAIAERIVDVYRAEAGDAVDSALLRFYQACRALTRAKLAALHLDDARPDGGRSKWIAQANDYLALARDRLLSPEATPRSIPPGSAAGSLRRRGARS